MALLGDLVVKIVGDTADFVHKIDQSGRKMTRFDRDMKKIARNMIRTGKALTMAITLPILGIAAAAIKTAGDFEASMNRVRAVTGATGDEMRELEEAARELGATTQFSAAQAADGMTFLAMAGFDANKIVGAMPAVLNLAAAAQIDMAAAADIASNILSGFNLDADELGGAIDIMAKTFTSSNTDLVQLGEAMSMVAPISEGLGVSMEETAAAIGILSNSGIQASRAGTGLRKILTTLMTEADRLGVVTRDASGEMRPLADILDDLSAAGLSAEDALEIFGDRAGPAITVLLAQGGDALRGFTEELENAGGTAETIANIQMEGLNGALKRFRSTAEEAGISIGNILMPAVMDLVESLRGLFERFNVLDDETKSMIIQYAAIAAAIGPLLLAIGATILIVQKLKAVMALLNITMAANPVILLTAAIAALAVGIVLALPVLVRAIRRHREYERQLGLTREALEELTEVERQRERAGLVEALEREAEEIRRINGRLRDLAEAKENQNRLSAQQMLLERDLNDRREETIEKFDALQGRIVDIDRLTVQYNQSLVAEQEAFDETTLSVDDYTASLNNGVVATDDLIKGSEKLAAAMGLIVDAVQKAGEEVEKIVKDVDVFTRQIWEDQKQARLRTLRETLIETRAMEEDAAKAYKDVWVAAIKDVDAKWKDSALVAEDSAEEAYYFTIEASKDIVEAVKDGLKEQQTDLEAFLDWYEENYIGRIIDSAQSLSTTLIDFANTRADAEIAAIEASGLAEEEKDARIRVIKRDQAQRDKVLGIFNATIDTAQAIIGYLADPGGIPGAVLSVLAGVTGAAQIATIAAQPLPALAAGGIVTGPVPAMVGEGGQPEIIFPLDQLSDFLAGRGDFDGGSAGDSTVIVNLDGGQILKYVGKASDDGRLLINQRSVV